MTIDRRQVLQSAVACVAVAVPALLPGCALAPAAASILKAAPYLPQPDPLATLIVEYRRQIDIFTERAPHEDWTALTEATYGPPLYLLWRQTPEPNSPAGVLAAMLLAKDEPDLYALASINEACIRYLSGVSA